jgi:hypothetical protein
MIRSPHRPVASALLVAMSSTLLFACAGGGNTNGGAGTSGGAGIGSGGAAAGTTGGAGSSGSSGTTGAGGVAGTAGTTGAAGTTGTGGGPAGTTGTGGGPAGTTGTGGGAAGTTGTGGGAAGTTGTGGGTGGLPSSAIIIQDNFDGTAASGPADAKWAAYPQGQTNLAPVIDTTRHQTGAHAAMATSSSSGLGSFLVPAAGALGGTPVTGNAFYVRVWINFQKPTTAITGHSAFIVGSAARDESGTELRLGISTNGPGNVPRLDLNLQNPSDSGGEVTRYSNGFTDGGNPASFPGTGYQFTAGSWTCVEAFFNGAASEFRLWIGDQELSEMHVTDFSANGAGRTHWAPTYNFIKIGAQDYSANLGQIWYDDVVVATQKIGCSYVVP